MKKQTFLTSFYITKHLILGGPKSQLTNGTISKLWIIFIQLLVKNMYTPTDACTHTQLNPLPGKEMLANNRLINDSKFYNYPS